MAKLGVNVDHVATLRQARGGREPDPIAAAILADLGGADGIVVHLREDRRHIQERDLKLLRDTVPNTLNLEMAVEESVAKIAIQVRPDKVTLVPERRQELTTEGGLAVTEHRERIKALIRAMHNAQIPVSLFIDPDLSQIRAAQKVGADAIELHTGRYANSRESEEIEKEFQALLEGAKLAHKLGLEVNAGHGLTYHNTQPLTEIHEIVEFNIGHSIISRAVLVGMERAVREMKALVSPLSSKI
ncbi:pyridoxine 5'-phosphate synthase [Candidatus Nitronereus thalassa]|uniref:Pyridoxine 5'-phosphate synthase n=1 Tax=Candidatus Nitronereus thalassa TaxID=3020898 RepID=A0ABU3K7D3_9BACT|nr:pyridoxine 5'-phosphate synthase [Candidatus Nitronereus thalassa]MDT7042300.1 pyridoxine 5'-phosphate synthase [Candidatus Nitronereus thalassa]